VGATCTVTETQFGNAQGPAEAVTVTVPDMQDPVVLATQVNTFAPEPPGPTPTPKPTTGGGSGSGGASLATTGVNNVERVLLASLGLLSVGGLILLWTRRRSEDEPLEGEA
jgi:hypothetical protein